MHLKPLESPKASILVLEQDPFLRAGLCSVLSAAGHRLAEPGDDHRSPVDLVLAGGQSSAGIRPDHAAPVILLVDSEAWTGLDFLDAANAHGAVAVLQRPFASSTLLCLIARVLAASRPVATPHEAALPGHVDMAIQAESPNFA